MGKIRKRLWLGDIYKYIVEDGSIDRIKGIDCLSATETKIMAILKQPDGRSRAYEWPAADEDERRKAVKAINKIISEVNKNVTQ
jgi:hypothetical protein